MSLPEMMDGTKQPEIHSPESHPVIKFAKEPLKSTDLIMPSLFGAGYGTYQVRPENFVLSFLTHTVAVGLLLWLLHEVVHPLRNTEKSYTVTPIEVPLSLASKK